MTFIAFVILAYLAYANATLARSPFYPPALFAGFWAALLLLLLIYGDHFYPLENGPLVVYTLGAACFSLGGLLVLVMHGRSRPAPRLTPRHYALLWGVLDVALVAMLAVLPFYLWRLGDIVASCRSTGDPFLAIRIETTSRESGALGFGVYAYIIALFDFLTLVAWSECDDSRARRMRCWIMAAVVLAYHISTASRLSAMLFIFSLFWISLLRNRKFALRPLIAGAIVVVVVFSSVAILLSKGSNREAGVLENVGSVADSFGSYLLSGSVAFNEVVRDPSIVQQNLFSFFYSVANAFGANFDVPNFEAVFVRTPDWTNVFTIYMSPYAQFGYVGTALYMLALGGICTWIYCTARQGASWAVVFYARIGGCLLLTGAADPFLRSLSMWIQTGAYCLILYYLLPILLPFVHDTFGLPRLAKASSR